MSALASALLALGALVIPSFCDMVPPVIEDESSNLLLKPLVFIPTWDPILNKHDKMSTRTMPLWFNMTQWSGHAYGILPPLKPIDLLGLPDGHHAPSRSSLNPDFTPKATNENLSQISFDHTS